VLVAVVGLMAAPAAFANQWNERTIIDISEPVLVPGATLQPGRYVFKLLDSDSNRHVVQIFKNGDERQIITQVQAVPTKRQEAVGDTVLKFNPTATGTPALKAWFYPGSRYGHMFVYSDRQARDIASRTKTIVLSTDVEGSDMEKGTLHIYDAQGQRKSYTPDAQMEREWTEWNQSQQRDHDTANEQKPSSTATTGGQAANSPHVSGHPANARVVSPTSGTAESTAPMMVQNTQAMKVRLDQLEDNPKQYTGKTISVDAEVETVHGPRLFTIDEPNWGDLEGETLVYMPSDLAALVREDDRITVTGTVRPFVKADIEREWGWLDADDEVVVELARKPVLVASRIVGGNNNVAMSIRAQARGDRAGEAGTAVGTSGTADTTGPSGSTAGATLTDARSIASGDEDLVGRRVRLENVQLSAGKERGLWLTTNGQRIYVLPSQGSSTASAGGNATVEGVVLQMPRAMRTRLNPGGDWNDDVYIYAFDVDR
jgi:hypothetical protein